MNSHNRMQGFSMNNPSPIACNLCGSNSASVRCEKCQSMAFCISCDDMYHRHPKRRYHLRKAVALEMNNQNFESLPRNETIISRPPISDFNSGHPSKMPIPPPRRKRKGLTLSSIKDTFATTGNMFRRFVNQEKTPPKASQQLFDKPIIGKPNQSVRPEFIQNQTRVMSPNHQFRPLPPPPLERDFPPPTPPKPTPLIYENFRKASLPSNAFGRRTLPGMVSSSIGDISAEPDCRQTFVSPVFAPNLRSNSLQRRNCSYHDLSSNQVWDSAFTHQQMCPHFVHANPYASHPTNPWITSSLTNSLEELKFDDEESDDERSSSQRHSKYRNRKSNMKRCKSAFQVVPVSPVPSPLPPGSPLVYYYYPNQFNPCSPQLSSSRQSLRTKSENRRPSNESTASSSKGQRLTNKNSKNKTNTSVGRTFGREMSDSGGRTNTSVTSSSRHQSDFEDEEHFYSVSEQSSSSNEPKGSGQWSCRFCTYFNEKDKNICEVCSKTRRLKKKSFSNNKNIKEKFENHSNPKTKAQIHKQNSNETQIQSESIDVFDNELIRQQREIEEELIRRLENERKVEIENEKIERKDLIRRKSFGLNADQKVIQQTKSDESDREKRDQNSSDNDLDSKLYKAIEANVNSNDKSYNNSDLSNKTVNKVEKGISTDPEISDLLKNKDNELIKQNSFESQLIQTQQSNDNNSNNTASNISLVSNQINNQTNGQTIDNRNIYQNNNHLNKTTDHYEYNSGFNSHILNSPQVSSHPMMSQINNGFVPQNLINNPLPQHNPYNHYPNVQNQMISHMHQMNGMNPMQQNYWPQMSSSQTHLDQLNGDLSWNHNYRNVLPQQTPINYGNRIMSSDSLHSLGSNLSVDQNRHKSELESGLHLIQLLREAEKSGFTADDLEVALNFNPNKPLDWLEENWNNMVETVLTLSNNQIMQNERKKGNKKALHMHLISDKEAKVALRLCKGNIWQSIEKCVQRKEENKLFGDTKSSFSLNISGLGSGKDNEDSNFVDANEHFVQSDDDSSDVRGIGNKNESQTDLSSDTGIWETDSPETNRSDSIEDFVTKRIMNKQLITNNSDKQMIEQLVDRWKSEKEIIEREKNKLRLKEIEKQKMNKLLELKKKFSIFNSEDTEEDLDLEVENAMNNESDLQSNHLIDNKIIDNEKYSDQENEFEDDLFDDKNSDDYNGIEFTANKRDDEEMLTTDGEPLEKHDISDQFYSDIEEYYSNSQSDDEFEKIDQRLQQKINSFSDKFDKTQSEDNVKLENQKVIHQSNEIESDFNLDINSGNDLNQRTDQEIKLNVQIMENDRIKCISEKTFLDKNCDKRLSVVDKFTSKHSDINYSENQKTIDNNTEMNKILGKTYLTKNSETKHKQKKENINEEIDPELNHEIIKQFEPSVKSKLSENLVQIKDNPTPDELKLEAKKILLEIDETLRKSLEDIELMDENTINKLVDETVNLSEINSRNTRKLSDTSLQAPVFGKERGIEQFRRASICDTIISSEKSKDLFAPKNQLNLNYGVISNVETDWQSCEGNNTIDSIPKMKAVVKEHNEPMLSIGPNISKREEIKDKINDKTLVQKTSENELKLNTKEVNNTHLNNEQNKEINRKTDCEKVNEVKVEKTCKSSNDSKLPNISDDSKLSKAINNLNKPKVFSDSKLPQVSEDSNLSKPSYDSKLSKASILSNQPKIPDETNEAKFLNGSKPPNISIDTNMAKASIDTNQPKVSNDSNSPKSKSKKPITKKAITETVSNQNPNEETLSESFIKSEKLEYSENFGWARTEYECEICATNHSINDMVSMISCTHIACKECLQQYFIVQIRERQRLVISCPFCDEPNIDPDDDESVFEYLGLLDQLIRYLVPDDVHELFQRKVRDRALMRDPSFRWCTECSSGFIAPNPQALTVMCPDCKSLTCAQCRKTWKKQHFNISCEQFSEWEKAMDPEYAEQQLDKHLKEFGIDCPNCKFKYQLAKGGCMHFRCVQCSYDFCGGCQRPFKMGIRCGHSTFCEKLGLHSHHPRNCLFYLRDKETNDLQALLDKNKVEYKTELETEQKTTRCPVMEQKDTDSGMKDESCGRYIENAGLCRLHYKEYLGDLIWKNDIDPIGIFNEDELELVLKRETIRIPPKCDKYRDKLINMILERLPLKPVENT